MKLDDVKVQFTQQERRVFMRRGKLLGGMGGLLKKLMQRTGRDGKLTLSAVDAKRAREYERDYGDGGYQGRLRVLLAAMQRSDEEAFRQAMDQELPEGWNKGANGLLPRS